MATVSLMTFSHMRVFCHECGADGRACRWCGSTGLVCPHCKGIGWVAEHQKGEASRRVRCPGCYALQPDNKTWLPDEERAVEGIMEYIYAWFHNQLYDEVLTRQADDAKAAAQAKIDQMATRNQRRGVWKGG